MGIGSIRGTLWSCWTPPLLPTAPPIDQPRDCGTRFGGVTDVRQDEDVERIGAVENDVFSLGEEVEWPVVTDSHDFNPTAEDIS